MDDEHNPQPSPTPPKKRRAAHGRGWLYARKDSPFLWCGYHLRGRESRESTGETSEQKARQFLKRRLDEVGADRIGAKTFHGPQADKIKMSDLLQDLRTNMEARGVWSSNQGSRMKHAVRFFGAMRVCDVNAGTFDEFKATATVRGGTPMNEGTENGVLQLVGQAVDLGRKNGKHAFAHIDWERNSIKRFRRTGLLGEVDVRKVADHLRRTGETARADFVMAAYLLYVRPEALAQLTVRDVTVDARTGMATTIFYSPFDDKEENGRDVSIGGEIATVIARRLAVVGDDPQALLFSRKSKGRLYPIREFARWFREAWIACGLNPVLNRKPIVFYHLRHAGVSRALRAGVSIPAAMVCGGWTSPNVLLTIYAKASPEELRESFVKPEKEAAKRAAEAAAAAAEAQYQPQPKPVVN